MGAGRPSVLQRFLGDWASPALLSSASRRGGRPCGEEAVLLSPLEGNFDTE
jgi:hypothetical protein